MCVDAMSFSYLPLDIFIKRTPKNGEKDIVGSSLVDACLYVYVVRSTALKCFVRSTALKCLFPNTFGLVSNIQNVEVLIFRAVQLIIWVFSLYLYRSVSVSIAAKGSSNYRTCIQHYTYFSMSIYRQITNNETTAHEMK